MKRFIILLVIVFSFISNVFAAAQLSVDELERVFKTYLQKQNGIIYAKVPRGLVISMDERIFFNEKEIKIKESSLPVLDTMSEILRVLPNEFVIEGHTTEETYSQKSWELSIARASNLAQYMTVYKKLSPAKVTPLGLADFVPYRYMTSNKDFNLNNRIDFVIIEYEAKR